jgi:hypothetical protein
MRNTLLIVVLFLPGILFGQQTYAPVEEALKLFNQYNLPSR